jgi:hypothetical protein
VKHARAVVATTTGLAETLARDWRKAERFYARFGVTESMFRLGVRSETVPDFNQTGSDPLSGLDGLAESREREAATFLL